MTASGTLRRRTILAMAGAAIGLACVAPLHADAVPPVGLQVIDRETGQALKLWRHDGRLFVAGAPGDRYGLMVTNRTDRRVLVVMSVDGVNILTGETAGYDQRGYIFGPHECYELDGWRKSMSEVADFTFTRLPQSYAALTGRPGNVGVIGIAVFDEAAPVAVAEPTPEPYETGRAAPEPPPLALRDAPAAPSPADGADQAAGVSDTVVVAEKRSSPSKSAPVAVTVYASKMPDRDAASPAPAPDEKLGTGHGAREYSELSIEPFERATSYPQYTEEVAYDTYDNLAAIGVIPTWRRGAPRPRPFPSSPDDGFVPDPPNG